MWSRVKDVSLYSNKIKKVQGYLFKNPLDGTDNDLNVLYQQELLIRYKSGAQEIEIINILIHLESTRIHSILKFYSSNFKIIVALPSLCCRYVNHF